MHILFLSDNFPPETNAPASRTFEHCRCWVKAGHWVTVITCAPNFPKGKVFEGYRNWPFSREQVEGIVVYRVWSFIAANEGFLKRTLDFLSFAFSATICGLFVKRPDIVIATSPQFFTSLAGYIVGLLRRVPFVFELRDIWPESLRAIGVLSGGRVFQLLEKMELFLYRRAARVIVVTNSFKQNLVTRGITPEKIDVVLNGADLTLFTHRSKDPLLLSQLQLGGRFVAGYIGTHGMAHGLETLLQAAQILQSDRATENITFLFLGEGAEKSTLKSQALKMHLRNVIFLDAVRRDEVMRYGSVLDVAIIHLKPTPLFETVIPSKIFECMAMGIPIALGVTGEAAELLEQSKAGVCFAPGDAASLAEVLRELSTKPELCNKFSVQGQKASINFDRSTQAQKMLDYLLPLKS